MELATTFEGFKKMSKEYFDAIPTLDHEGLEAGFKCLGIAFIQSDLTEGERLQASYVLKLATEQYIRREVELEKNPD